jgi:membrane protein implicated in regulation of membrane protease activity
VLLVLALVAALLWLPSPLGWILASLAVVWEVGETAFLIRWSRRRRARVGAETLVGRRALVVVACRPEGQVRMDGELWRAACPEGADVGDDVEVAALNGLTLAVRRLPDGYGATRPPSTNAS